MRTDDSNDEGETMTAWASEAWVDAWWSALRADQRVRDAAASWVYGPWLLVVEPDAAAGVPEAVVLRIDMHDGVVRDMRLATIDALRHSPWTFTAPYARWKSLLSGEGSLLESVTSGRVQATGDLPELHRHASLAASILAVAATVPVVWPEDEPEHTLATQGGALTAK